MSFAGFNLDTAMRRTCEIIKHPDYYESGYMAASTFCPFLFAAFMRDVMLAMFSVSCFARWGFTCISSAMVVV